MSDYADAILMIIFYLSLIVVAFRAGRRLHIPLVKEPCCPVCRTAVSNMTTMICPNCSSDLREVGLPIPEMRRPLSFKWMTILWTIFLPVTTTIVMVILYLIPVPLIHQSVASYQNQISYVTKDFKYFANVNINGELRSRTYWAWQDQQDWQPDTDWKNVSQGFVTIVITTENQYKPNGIITINPLTHAWKLTTQDDSILKGTSQFDGTAFAQCLNRITFNDNNIAWKPVTDIIPNLISGRQFDPDILSKYNNMPGWLITKPYYILRIISPDSTEYLPFALTCLIYILGLIIIHRYTKQEKITFNQPAKTTTQPQP